MLHSRLHDGLFGQLTLIGECWLLWPYNSSWYEPYLTILRVLAVFIPVLLYIMHRTGLRMPLEAERNELEAIAHEQDSMLSDRFRVLDVGACHNRTMENLKDSFDITAFDLEPAPLFVDDGFTECANDSSPVLRGDFLFMKILKQGPPVVSEIGNLLGVRESSMDIVVMSLVLSYLPDALQRYVETEVLVCSNVCSSSPPDHVYHWFNNCVM